jgi:hypothetical protein
MTREIMFEFAYHGFNVELKTEGDHYWANIGHRKDLGPFSSIEEARQAAKNEIKRAQLGTAYGL